MYLHKGKRDYIMPNVEEQKVEGQDVETQKKEILEDTVGEITVVPTPDESKVAIKEDVEVRTTLVPGVTTGKGKLNGKSGYWKGGTFIPLDESKVTVPKDTTPVKGIEGVWNNIPGTWRGNEFTPHESPNEVVPSKEPVVTNSTPPPVTVTVEGKVVATAQKVTTISSILALTPHTFSNKVILNEGMPVIYLTREVHRDMCIITNEAAEEIGWLGTVKKVGRNYVVTELFLPKQSANATTCEISEDGISAIIEELKKEGRDYLKIANEIRFWGHSHHTMGSTPSGQDDKQLDELATSCGNYFISAITTKGGRIEFVLYLYEAGLEIHDCTWKVWEPNNAKRVEMWKAAIKERVSKKAFTHVVNQYGVHVNQFGVPKTGREMWDDQYGELFDKDYYDGYATPGTPESEDGYWKEYYGRTYQEGKNEGKNKKWTPQDQIVPGGNPKAKMKSYNPLTSQWEPVATTPGEVISKAGVGKIPNYKKEGDW